MCPINCTQGFLGYDACRGCRWLDGTFYCWPPPRNKGEKGTSIFEILTLNERICLIEDDLKDIVTFLAEQPLPPNYKRLLDRVEQLTNKTEHIHQEFHTRTSTKKYKDYSMGGGEG
ncbi:unnamed protein product [marine sediment metagenome]|uniref:Uncharacterized protein n=1 Tax=marine sediment metagenome TaxID=412755 RepID=X1DCD2_9ZZZZ